MAGFLYFIPDVQKVDKQVRKETGLDIILDNTEHSPRHTAPGPGGAGNGFIIVPKCAHPDGATPRTGYYPDTQEWIESITKKYWIGWQKDKFPKPEDLMRKECVAGHIVTLGDGNKWEIPVARDFANGCSLPETLVLGPTGELVREALPKYAVFSRKAERLWDTWNYFCREKAGLIQDGDEEPEFLTDAELYDFMCEAISMNYMVDKWIIAFLKIVTTTNIQLIQDAIIDVPTLIQMQLDAAKAQLKKKNAETKDTSSSLDGPKDSSPDITPHTEISTSLQPADKE